MTSLAPQLPLLVAVVCVATRIRQWECGCASERGGVRGCSCFDFPQHERPRTASLHSIPCVRMELRRNDGGRGSDLRDEAYWNDCKGFCTLGVVKQFSCDAQVPENLANSARGQVLGSPVRNGGLIAACIPPNFVAALSLSVELTFQISQLARKFPMPHAAGTNSRVCTSSTLPGRGLPCSR